MKPFHYRSSTGWASLQAPEIETPRAQGMTRKKMRQQNSRKSWVKTSSTMWLEANLSTLLQTYTIQIKRGLTEELTEEIKESGLETQAIAMIWTTHRDHYGEEGKYQTKNSQR